MKKSIGIVLILLITVSSFSQQDPQFSHNMFNLTGTNSAYAGAEGIICAKLISRQQWVGIDGAPSSSLLTIDMPVQLFGTNSGIGITILDDRLGLEKNFNASVTYAYHKSVGEGWLSFGTTVGVLNKSIEGEWKLPQYEGNTGGTDPAIPESGDQNSVFDVNLGIMYRTSDYYLGLSSTHIAQPDYKFTNVEIPYLKRHYFLIGGYNLDVASSLIELQPSFMVKSDGASSQFSFNLNALYNKKIWGGVTYRAEDALVVLAGVELMNGLKIGYAYDLTTSKLSKPGSGSHEIMLGYCFQIGIERNPQKYKSVRFL